jgi:hypothetical protein
MRKSPYDSRVRVIRALLCCLAAPATLAAQPASLSGRVVAQGSGEPLAYAIVRLEGLERAQFASDSGTFFFGELPAGGIAVRVRRLGYQPLDTSIVLAREGPTVVTLQLQRTAVRLSEVTVRSYQSCKKPGAPKKSEKVLAQLFTQLRMNAEQYEFLTDKYPLHYLLQVQQSRRLKAADSVVIDSTFLMRIDAAPKWRYKPGRLVVREGGGWFVHLPVLVDFANKDFISNHCFDYGGVTRVGDDSVFRLDVVAAERLRTVDVSGSIYLDRDDFQIRRTVLSLTSPWGRFGDVVDFEMTTDFREILAPISIISRLYAVQRMDPGVTRIDHDHAYETQVLQEYQFLKDKPGEVVPRRRK